MFLYVLCFDPPMHHAGHYLGSTTDLKRRIHDHLKGDGAVLVRSAIASGSKVYLGGLYDVKTLDFSLRQIERFVKNRSNAHRLCCRCTPPSFRYFSKFLVPIDLGQLDLGQLDLQSEGR